MTKRELTAELANRLHLPNGKAAAVVNLIFGSGGLIASELRRGNRVKLSGFGHFETKARAARNGRDPRTGDAIAIGSSTAPVFRPGKPLRDLLNKKR